VADAISALSTFGWIVLEQVLQVDDELASGVEVLVQVARRPPGHTGARWLTDGDFTGVDTPEASRAAASGRPAGRRCETAPRHGE
jgi:hypothetical protein